MARARDWLVASAVLLLGRGGTPGRRRLLPKLPPRPGAELVVLALFGLSFACAVGFVAVYAIDALPAQTQLLGLTFGSALLFFAAALVVAGKTIVPEEELDEPYPPEEHPEEQRELDELVEEVGDGLTRGRLLKLGLLGAGGALGVAAITPAASFGPFLRVKDFFGTPWARGRRLVDETGRPWRASDIEENAFYTAFPEGADRELLGSPLIVVRVPAASVDLPPELAGYDANGIVAYSKICTHAGCAISMYRAPLFQPDEPKPALVCPCHYSTFDPATGGTVLFGPAGRKLPMLPLAVDARGFLRAKGNFDGAVGPSWWGVRNRKPNP